jgi:hypothetical protein
MKIDILPVEPDAPASRPTNVQAQQWRKALEQAQWASRQRIAPTRAEASERTSELPARASAQATPTRGVVGAAAASAALAATVVPSRTAALAQSMAAAARAAIAARSPAAQGQFAAAVGTPEASRPAVAVPAEEAAASPSLPWAELPEWPSVVLYSNVQGNRVSMGMRDASMSEQEGLELFYRLRAELSAAGLELGEMIINGRPVTPAA